MVAERILARLTLAVLALAVASPAAALNLLEVYRLAEQNDAEFNAARHDYMAAREAWPQARAAVLPQVNASASYSEVDREIRDTGDTDDFTRENYRIALRQTLFNWQQFAGLDRADREVARAEAEFASVTQDLIIRVADRYFTVLAASEGVRFAQAELEAIERQLDQAQERFEVGLIAITDVKAAQASYDLAVSREIRARNDLENAREDLRRLLGQPAGELSRLVDDLEFSLPDPDDPDRWVETAIEQNPDLLAALAGAEAARHGVRQARAGHYPTLDLVASYDRDRGVRDATIPGGEADIDSQTIGIELNLPLFAGGATTSGTREARSGFEASQSRVVSARRGAEQGTRNAYRGLTASISQVRALARAVESNEAAVEATRAGFRVGTRTAVDVLNALRDLYSAERDYAQARYDYVLNHLRLKQAAGTLTEDDVRLVNTWLINTGY